MSSFKIVNNQLICNERDIFIESIIQIENEQGLLRLDWNCAEDTERGADNRDAVCLHA